MQDTSNTMSVAPPGAPTNAQLNNGLKQMTSAIAGKVPYVGPILSVAVDIFWPTDTPSLWSQIKDQVQNLVSQDIAEQNKQQLQNTLTGLNGAVSQYLQLTDPAEQQANIEAMAVTFVTARPTFMAGDPASNFSLFWSMAMLHLSVLRWRVEAWAGAQKPNTVPQTDLQNAAIAYALYGRVALSRIYNNRLSQLQVTQISNNEPGKNSNWILSFNILDQQTGQYLDSHSKRIESWTPHKVDWFVRKFHADLVDAWNDFAGNLQNTLGPLAFDHIQTLEATWPPPPPAQALALLQTGPNALPDYKTFAGTYYPTQSLYNDPDVNPTQTTPQVPPAPAPPPQ